MDYLEVAKQHRRDYRSRFMKVTMEAGEIIQGLLEVQRGVAWAPLKFSLLTPHGPREIIVDFEVEFSDSDIYSANNIAPDEQKPEILVGTIQVSKRFMKNPPGHDENARKRNLKSVMAHEWLEVATALCNGKRGTDRRIGKRESVVAEILSLCIARSRWEDPPEEWARLKLGLRELLVSGPTVAKYLREMSAPWNNEEFRHKLQEMQSVFPNGTESSEASTAYSSDNFAEKIQILRETLTQFTYSEDQERARILVQRIAEKLSLKIAVEYELVKERLVELLYFQDAEDIVHLSTEDPEE